MRNLTRPLAARAPIGEHYVPPAFFYQIPRVEDYFGSIEAMLLDDQVAAALQLRKRRALAMPWKWSEDSDSTAVAFLQDVFTRLTLEHDFEDALACLENGFIPCEPLWHKEDGQWFVKRIERRDPRRFRFAKDGSLHYQTPALEWQPVPEHRVLVFTHQATLENPYGRSVLEPCYPRWQGKWKVLAQLERLGDKYSIPPVVALTDATDDGQLNTISANLAALESAAGVALSGVKDVKALEVQGKGADLLAEIKDHDAAMAKVLTGQVLALDKGDTGSYALGKVHENSLDAVALLDFKAMLRKLSRTLVVSILTLNNIPGKARMVFDEEAWKESNTPPAPSQPNTPMELSAAAEDSLSLML